MNRILLLIILVLGSTNIFAQVEINGSVDVSIKFGGSNSGYFINGIHQDFNHLHARVEEFNLSFFSPISDEWYIEALSRVKNDASGKPSPPKLELASINYSPLDKNYFLSAGKIIMPFGFYSSRQFQIDRTFIDFPMAYSWSIFMSRERGWWKGTRGKYDTADINLSSTDYGVQSIFYGGYTTGLIYGIEFDQASLKLALTNESPAGYDASTIDTYGGMIRFTHSPSMYFTYGLSAAHGSFMHETSVNDTVMANQDFSEFTQSSLGADFQIGFTYFEIIGEATYSLWNTPGYDQEGFITLDSGELEEFSMSNLQANIDVRYEPPFFTGGYFAFRYDNSKFFEGKSENGTRGNFKWDYDTTRFTALIGYKVDRNVLLKVAVSEEDDFSGKFLAFKALLTATF